MKHTTLVTLVTIGVVWACGIALCIIGIVGLGAGILATAETILIFAIGALMSMTGGAAFFYVLGVLSAEGE